MNTKHLNQFALAVLMAGLASVIPAQAQSTFNGTQDDVALATNVKAALLQAAPFQDADVDIAVTASNGQVNLSGWVTYANDPQAAAKIAASVSGVKAVTTSFHTWSSDSDYRV